MSLAGRVVVVTGSTRGIGRAIAEACGRAGAKVVVSSRRAPAVREAVSSLVSRGIEATGIPADVVREEDHDALLAHALESFGRVDGWVNNAGLSGGYRPLEEMSPTEIRDVVAVNVAGVMLGCRAVLPHMVEHRGGIVLNVTGRGGRGEATPFTAVYGASKAAVTSVTKSLAEENQDVPVSIHLLVPSMVRTSFFEDMVVSPSLAESAKTLPFVLDAIAVPAHDVGAKAAAILAQEPGRATGKTYSVLSGTRLLRGILTLMRYRVTGKMRPERRVRA